MARATGSRTSHGVEPLCYRLPELQGNLCVASVEGEADADCLAGIGLAATTNHGGAGKWRAAHTAQLVAAGIRNVYAFTDNDRAGVEHRAQVAASCLAAGLEVYQVDLPGLGPVKDQHGEDVRDWFGLGHTPAELPRSSWRPRRGQRAKDRRTSARARRRMMSGPTRGRGRTGTRASGHLRGAATAA